VNAVMTAIIFVPKAHVAAHLGTCLAYCTARGYEVGGIVSTSWLAVLAIRLTGDADVIVVARPDHIDPEQELRVEVVSDQNHVVSPPRPGSRAQRRPRRLN
jgi:hypothetical protein